MTSQSINWKQHFNSLVSNEEANKTMDEFSNAIAAAKSQSENLRAITEDRNAIIFFVDQDGNIHAGHSPLTLEARDLAQQTRSRV